MSISSDDSIVQNQPKTKYPTKIDRVTAALNLPKVASYNLRSLGPKVQSLKTDLIERSIELAFLQEIWEPKENRAFHFEIEKMFEMHGLQYVSKPRPPNAKGRSYGGVAIVVNNQKFSCERLNILTPKNIEVVWGLLKPKNLSPSLFKKIIVCSFYSPPSKGKHSKLADHIVTTLHMLMSKYPGSGIILGADKNSMDITPILSCGLKLHQIVDKNTRKDKVLDIIIMNTSGYYQSPIIAPPIQPDDPNTGQPSDHSVPVCTPHTDRYTRPVRHYKIIKYRPLPESSVKRFGEWMVSESWDAVRQGSSPTEQARIFEDLFFNNLNKYCPVKEMKIGSQDKPFINAELKKIDRRKRREYQKRGKSEKFLELKKQFDQKYKDAAEKYLNKQMDELRVSKPGQAFSVLKRLGGQPGDCTDNNTFSLPVHESESLSPEQCAESIAQHFSQISQEFPPLSLDLLPARVKDKIQSGDIAPIISEYDTYIKIRAAKKPKSGTQYDLPKSLIQEFGPELATPVSVILNNIFQSGHWPAHWKLENVVPIGKTPIPETEEDLRPISLTPFFSKVAEHFVAKWLLEYIGDKLDFRQYGGQKGNSITHYVIEFINFILLSQDSSDQIAVMAAMIDFSKAFNRQNHNILITKLSDMGVPGWLLRIVIAFLKDRKMQVNYKGKFSGIKSLPGGGPQGTILALLLFIVLINDIGFEGQQNNVGDIITSKKNLKIINEIHLKYVDDMTLAEAINLPEKLVKIPDRPRPDSFHARTGHALPQENSRVYNQILRTKEFASKNDMKINYNKTKVITFNPCTSIDFMPEIKFDNKELELVDEVKLLGLTIRSDMKWTSNTQNMLVKAYRKLWILRRLKSIGAKVIDLVEIYTKQIRSILEFAAPAWQGSITQAERIALERVQKCAFHIILGDGYLSYKNALSSLGLETLEVRRRKLSLKFAIKSSKHRKFKTWFKQNEINVNTRQHRPRFCEVNAKHARFEKSAISYLTKLLNEHHKK